MSPNARPNSAGIDLSDEMPLPRAILRGCRRSLWRRKLTDTTGQAVTGGQLLMRALILRRLLLREVLSEGEQRVGVLLPPSTGAAIVNAALALAGKEAVNLNYSASGSVIDACAKAAGLKHILCTQKALDKFGLELECDVVMLDSLKDKLRTSDKIAGAVGAYATPIGVLERRFGVADASLDDVVSIIFTSGSTGLPKGVMLSHRNILANVRSIERAVKLRGDDVLIGILPFFHAFGYTVTLCAPLVLDLGAAYHFNPLDARQIGKLARETGGTILLSTPTFLRSFLKRVPPEDFQTLEVVIVGAEKLPQALSDAFEKRFGVRPSEGYGVTEMGPVVSVNIPPCRASDGGSGTREGSIGRVIPMVRARVVDPDTNEPLPPDQEGMLEVAGPNRMLGYLDQPEKTAEVIRDGWYVTGDIARIDKDGYIFITGRQSRFSKIGGEMVPHVRVEEEIQQLLGGDNAEEQLAVVTAVPDAKKGERLVVVHLACDRSPQQICEHLQAQGLPNLWVPSPDCFLQVEALPLLGSGKLDLKGLAKLAAERFA